MPNKVTLAFGADHAGFELKEQLKKYAEDQGHDVVDFGTDSTESCDYPVIVPLVVDALRRDVADFGVLICGSGIGVDIVANRHRCIRSALCHEASMAKSAREHNNANVLSLGAKYVDVQTAKNCLDQFLSSDFSDEPRHQRRVGMIDTFM